MPPIRGLGFVGRTTECQRLDGMLAHARDSQSAVVVIHGELGIGKTALLRYAARQASGMRITQLEGVQAEMELPFAAIHRLCAPILAGLEGLTEPQRNALRVALGMSSGDPPDRFLVAVAVLNLLATAAEERPLLCLVDDAQWVDAASVHVLGFVARRLLAEPVAMMFSLRESAITRALDGLPQLSLKGLADPDARALPSRAVPGRLDDRVRDRIIAETQGNPLALVNLSQKMSPAERAAGLAPPTASDLPTQLTDEYLRRIAGLPEATQRMMLLAAADPLGDATLLWRAAEHLSTDPAALAHATEAGLVEIDDQVDIDGEPRPAVRADADPGPAGAGSRGLRIDRGCHPRWHGTRARTRGEGGVLGRRGAVQRSRAPRGGGSGGLRSRHGRPSPVAVDVGAVRAGRGRRARRRHQARNGH